MLTKRNRILVIFLAFFAAQCATQQVATEEVTKTDESIETVTVESPYPDDHCFFHPTYVETPERHFDLIHTRIEGRLNWANQTFPANATLTLTPHHYPQQELLLDAKGMQIKTVKWVDSNATTLTHAYDNRYLTISFSETLKAGDTITLSIDYIAQPEEWARIDSLNPRTAKGLYFIDPLDTLPYYPRQAWTQGQTTGSSVWFPTIDHPNQRTTQEILITVADSMTTFSNGVLHRQIDLDNDLRQDHWLLDKPHAPYLAALAVGKFDMVTDTAGNVPIAYYMEPQWAPYAAEVFGSTKPMIPVFEDALGVPFPWPEYRQIAVRDFVAGGMENTGATIMYSNMNIDDRTLLDRDFEGLIAHELFHQWFGDMVTTESWPQLVLNEGMASYGEYIWARAAGGKDREQHEVFNDKTRYLDEVDRSGAAPIVRFYEPNPGRMFNRHTYQKGAQVWRMLENYLGRESFFAGLKHYLTDHAYQSVDLHDYRLAFEEVTGKDLLWFFDQWLIDEGHPIITIDYAEGPKKNQTTVTLSQRHIANPDAIYRLPIPIYVNNNMQWIDWHSRDTSMVFTAQPTDIRIDPDRTLLAEWEDNRTATMWEQAMLTGSFFERWEAFQYFSDSTTRNVAGQMLALQDSYWGIREMAINQIPTEGDGSDNFKQKLMQLAVNDPSSKVRSAALSRLLNFNDPALTSFYLNTTHDSSYGVVAKGLIGLTTYDQPAAMRIAPRFEDAPLQALTLAVGYVYAYTPVEDKSDFFLRQNHRINRGATAEWYGYIGNYFRKSKNANEIKEGMMLLKREALTQRSGQLARFAFTMMQRVRQGWQTELNELRLNKLENDRRTELEELDTWATKQLEAVIQNSQHELLQEETVD